MTTHNLQVAEIQTRVESLEGEAKSIQSQIDEVWPIFMFPIFESLQFLCSSSCGVVVWDFLFYEGCRNNM